jgi:hypothetical protein
MLENIFIIPKLWTLIIEFPEPVLVYRIIKAVPVDVARKSCVHTHIHSSIDTRSPIVHQQLYITAKPCAVHNGLSKFVSHE